MLSTRTPSAEARRTRSRNPELSSHALVGMQPRWRQVPPTLSRSMRAAVRPSCVARMAAVYPPFPPPTTTRSNSSTTCLALVTKGDTRPFNCRNKHRLSSIIPAPHEGCQRGAVRPTCHLRKENNAADYNAFSMDFRLQPHEEALRHEVCEFLRAELGSSHNSDPAPMPPGYMPARDFELKLGAKGWLGISWPPEYGGRGRPMREQFIVDKEIALHGGNASDALTRCIIAPMIIAAANEDQRRRYLPGMARGAITACLGYSEPSAGSDFASLQTRAVRDGDDYVINGRKIWTSGAESSEYWWLAARTDGEGARRQREGLGRPAMAKPDRPAEDGVRVGGTSPLEGNTAARARRRLPRTGGDGEALQHRVRPAPVRGGGRSDGPLRISTRGLSARPVRRSDPAQLPLGRPGYDRRRNVRSTARNHRPAWAWTNARLKSRLESGFQSLQRGLDLVLIDAVHHEDVHKSAQRTHRWPVIYTPLDHGAVTC